MARTILKHKVALVLGADNPVGRAVALQLSREGARVVLAGFHDQRLEELEKLIISKDGEPFVAPLKRGSSRNGDIIRVGRESLGHFHFVVNAMAYGESPSDQPSQAADDARDIAEPAVSDLKGRGIVRFLTIWPLEAGATPAPAAPAWHAIINAPESMVDAATKGEGLRPAAVADAAVQLLQCPPGACPVSVTLEHRLAEV